MSALKILVTGGNAGIGYALCKQLVIDHGCHVLLGARSEERGREAVSTIEAMAKGSKGSIELVHMDVGMDASVLSAAEQVKSKLEGDAIYAIVNNAGVGLQSQATSEELVNINLYGPKRVIDAFGPCLKSDGRVVNVGSGSGPSYVKNCPPEIQKLLCNEPESWEQIVSWVDKSSDGKSGVGSDADSSGGYGVSKALLASYSRLLAREHPEWQISCCSPGFIDTKLTAGYGASKTPEEGTVAIRKLLFEPLEGNGWYYGSDGVRSPYHFMRNPGEPVYDGVPPY